MPHWKLVGAALLGSLVSVTGNAQPAVFVPVTDEMLRDPDPADWRMWRRTLNHWGYSPLVQIDRGNVRELRLVWAHPIYEGVQEGTPLVYES